MFSCQSDSLSLPLVRFGLLLHYADKRILNNESVYRKKQLSRYVQNLVKFVVVNKCFFYIHRGHLR